MGTMEYVILFLGVLYLIWRFILAKGIKQIIISELKEELKNKNNQFIDVRTPGEFKQSSIKSFKNIPLNELPNKVEALDKNRPVFVICQSGMRSSNAARLLKKKGFKEIINVRGGMNAWR
ncbi:rhodanese-like domain-containing protein [Alloiococcus sp. CFN-8]|uniref:rhodanese-like domain-containing protein n=1 Tax=Alloiococcus sp. CFN-8 TaxID=3416081 RepID=UPI003CF8C6A7